MSSRKAVISGASLCPGLSCSCPAACPRLSCHLSCLSRTTRHAPSGVLNPLILPRCRRLRIVSAVRPSRPAAVVRSTLSCSLSSTVLPACKLLPFSDLQVVAHLLYKFNCPGGGQKRQPPTGGGQAQTRTTPRRPPT